MDCVECDHESSTALAIYKNSDAEWRRQCPLFYSSYYSLCVISCVPCGIRPIVPYIFFIFYNNIRGPKSSNSNPKVKGGSCVVYLYFHILTGCQCSSPFCFLLLFYLIFHFTFSEFFYLFLFFFCSYFSLNISLLS